MPSGPTIILMLKSAVVAVTVLLLLSLWALKRGNVRLHGRLNHLFFVLTMTTVLGFEGLIKFGVPVTTHFQEDDYSALRFHLAFVIPLLPVMVLMLMTGRWRKRAFHVLLANVFVVLWAGMFVTGVFFLPH